MPERDALYAQMREIKMDLESFPPSSPMHKKLLIEYEEISRRLGGQSLQVAQKPNKKYGKKTWKV